MAEAIKILKLIWKPTVEVIILAVIIYYLFGFLRRSRGWPVVIGFILLLSLTVVATVLEFQVLSWLLQAFFAFSAFAILVIFQPELRRLLAEIGSFPLSTPADRDQRQNIEVIVQAVERLSEAHIGALIAIERTVSLVDLVGNPVPVDCLATPEMLESIFFPNKAIHDGAVIIKDDRILYAACILPLTQREDLNKSLGTRHRAAIGLSEESDAIVIVVSEETSKISYAYKGELVRNVSIEELRAFLTSMLVKRQRPYSFLRWLRIRLHGVIAWLTEKKVEQQK